MSLKIVGAGFGRTGTFSLKAALELLGFSPCHHMEEVFKHPEEVETWHAATRGKDVDWKSFMSGYQASVDWPACEFWRELSDVFPDAKVLLSVRDPASWQRSFAKTIQVELENPARPDDPGFMAWHAMTSDLIAQRRFGGSFAPETMIRTFNDHVAEVTAAIPADRLLTYDVREGWDPLCRFLNVPVPDQPFPNTNTTQDFVDDMNKRRQGGQPT